MISKELITPGLLKIKVFWNKGYDTIIPVLGVTKETFPSDSNYIVDMIIWPKFGNISITMSDVIIS